MNRGLVAMVAGCSFAAASWCVGRAVAPPSRRLADVRRMLGTAVAGAGTHPVPQSRLGTPLWRLRAGVDTAVGQRLGDGLRLVGLDAHRAVGTVLSGALVGLVLGVFGLGLLLVSGSLPAHPVWSLGPVGVAVAAGRITWSDITTRIARRRSAVRRAVADLVQMLAVGLTGDQAVDEALDFALDVGEGPVAAELRESLRSASVRGLTTWEAVAEAGERLDQRELGELAEAIERQGVLGVGVAETVARLARTMRERHLAEIERDAERANADLAGPTLVFVLTTVVFLGYPLAMRIGTAFGA